MNRPWISPEPSSGRSPETDLGGARLRGLFDGDGQPRANYQLAAVIGQAPADPTRSSPVTTGASWRTDSLPGTNGAHWRHPTRYPGFVPGWSMRDGPDTSHRLTADMERDLPDGRSTTVQDYIEQAPAAELDSAAARDRMSRRCIAQE
jgi:hypothetical protein